MTIEERAERYANDGKGNLNRYHRKQSYIRIATEQKAIDIAMLKKVLAQRLICFNNTEEENNEGREWIDSVIKAMEE